MQRELDYMTVEFENDCLMIVTKLLFEEEDLSFIEHIIYLIRNKLKNSFISKVLLVESKCNVLIHVLAQCTQKIQNHQVWIGDSLDFITPANLMDLNICSRWSLQQKN